MPEGEQVHAPGNGNMNDNAAVNGTGPQGQCAQGNTGNNSAEGFGQWFGEMDHGVGKGHEKNGE